MGKINILFFEPSTGYGGSARCLLEWLRYLDKEAFSPLVITYYDGPAVEKIKKAGIEVKRLPYISFIKRLILSHKGAEFVSYLLFLIEMIFNILPTSFLLILLIKKRGINLIDINTSIITGIPGILASRVTNIPCVCHIHDTRKLTKKEKFFGKWVKRFFVLTAEAFKLYSKDLGERKLTLVYNGLNLDEWKFQGNNGYLLKEFRINKDNPVVGMVGRLTSGKGHADFIKAAKLINNVNRNVKFLIVGGIIFTEQKLEWELKNLVHNLELDDTVIFTGWREEISKTISLLDILVFPSSTFPEGFPLTCIEAMALNKPVVATNISGPNEIILNGITGYFVHPCNPEELAEKTLKLINNPQLAKNMGLAGRKRVEELFDVKKHIVQITNVYNESLK